jgi:hypothetical protein
MPPGAVLLIAIIVIAVVAAAVFFNEEARIKRALRKTPRASIAQVADGADAKITGTVEIVGDSLAAPLTGRRCVYFEVTVEEYRSSGKSGSWRTIIREKQGVPFRVRDATGKAMVNLGAARMAVVKDAHFRSGTFNDATPELEAFLERYGKKSTGFLGFNRKLRYKEGALEAGEEVAVAGRGMWEPDPDPEPGAAGGYRDAPRRLVMTGGRNLPLLVSDDPATLG